MQILQKNLSGDTVRVLRQCLQLSEMNTLSSDNCLEMSKTTLLSQDICPRLSSAKASQKTTVWHCLEAFVCPQAFSVRPSDPDSG